MKKTCFIVFLCLFYFVSLSAEGEEINNHIHITIQKERFSEGTSSEHNHIHIIREANSYTYSEHKIPVPVEEIKKPEEFIIPQTESPPEIDGVLDDACWQEAVKLPLNFQIWPMENIKPSEDTLVYMAYDADNIYIAFQAFDSEPDKIWANVTGRDDIFGDDRVGICFDTYYDQRSYYAFDFNPFGIQADSENGNYNWDTQLTSKGLLNEEGYVVEVLMPFSSIKFPDTEFDTVWGLYITRYIPRKEEEISWMPDSRDEPNWQLQEGSFHGFEDIDRGFPVEIMPVLVTSSTGEVNDEEQFVNGPVNLDPGLNMKFGLTSNLTLDVTLNPDFSQVEADAPQIDVNTRFPIFISEKRPFFLEGQEIFSTPFRVLHTRQIVDPDYGVKLTGKVGKNTLGFILASDAAPGKLCEPGEAGYGENALFTIFRMKRDIFEESEVGLILTDREFANSFNRVYGLDGELRSGKYSFSFQAINSETEDESDGYRAGGAYQMNLDYWGRNFYCGLSHSGVHPDFEASSGFIYRTDYKSYNAFAGYDFEAQEEEDLLRSWGPSAYATWYYDYNGTLTEYWLSGDLYFSLSNRTDFGIWYDSAYIRYEGTDFYPSTVSLWFSNSYSETISGGFSLSFGDEINYDPDRLFMGKGFGVSIDVDLKFSEKFRNSFSFSKNSLTDPLNDETIFDVSVFRNSTTYQFTEALAFRSILDFYNYGYDFGGNIFEANFLLTWTPNPGTVFFLGYDTLLQEREGRGYESDRNMFFMKMSYLFNL